MKKILTTILLFILCSKSAFAENASSLGIGYQYGGAIGFKFDFKEAQNNYFASLGLLGGAVGYQRFTASDNKQAFGIMAGAEVLASEKGFIALTYNYYLQGFENEGWVVGASIGLRRTDGDLLGISGIFGARREVKTKTLISVNAGYRF